MPHETSLLERFVKGEFLELVEAKGARYFPYGFLYLPSKRNFSRVEVIICTKDSSLSEGKYFIVKGIGKIGAEVLAQALNRFSEVEEAVKAAKKVKARMDGVAFFFPNGRWYKLSIWEGNSWKEVKTIKERGYIGVSLSLVEGRWILVKREGKRGKLFYCLNGRFIEPAKALLIGVKPPDYL